MGLNKFCMFENQCNRCNTLLLEVELMLFNAMVVQELLYGVYLWGGTISLSSWNEIEKIQKMFSRRPLGVKDSTSYSIMLLEIGARLILSSG